MAKQKVSKRLTEITDKALKKAGGDIEKASNILRSELERIGDTALIMEVVGEAEWQGAMEAFLKETLGPEFEEALAKARPH
jgi:hypothetical protein